MDSRRLSQRAKQPGHDRTFVASETNFVQALRSIVPNDQYDIVEKPRDLRNLFGEFGVEPEALIRNVKTGKVMYFEVKKQGSAGNAEERAMKHHTVEFYRTLKARTGADYHAYCTIFCESLATLPRYTTKFRYLIEEGHYFLWKDYDVQLLKEFIRDNVLPHLA